MLSIVYNSDCLTGMKQYPDKYFDLAVVDPPYGIFVDNMQLGSHPTRSRTDGFGSGPAISTAVRLKQSGKSKGSGKLKNRLLNQSDTSWDVAPSEEYFNELFRVSKNQIIWGGNYFNLPPTRGFMIWNKLQPWENFSQAEFAWTSIDMPAKLISLSNTGGANSEKKIHPTQKPVDLYDWIYSRCLPEGGKVLDTHLGSGSNRISAYKRGNIDFVAYELDTDYFTAQEKRFDEFKKSFDPASLEPVTSSGQIKMF